MCYLAIGEATEDVVGTRSSCVKIANELMPNDDDALSTCCSTQQSTVTKHNRLCNEFAGENSALAAVAFEEDNNGSASLKSESDQVAKRFKGTEEDVSKCKEKITRLSIL